MTTLAHVSDSHFGTADPVVLDALIADVHAIRPDAIVLTGDLTQRARAHQFRAARRFIDALPPVPWLAVPGNHDLPLFNVLARALMPYRGFRRWIAAELEPTLAIDDALIIGVNSTRAHRRKDGEADGEQIARIAGVIAGAHESAYRVVAMHHPLAVLTDRDADNLVHGAEQALERWIEAGADLFLGGHIHLPYCLPVANRAGRRALVVQAGTGVSRRTRGREPNSYNRIELGAELVIERRDFDRARGRFLRGARLAGRRDEGGWRASTFDYEAGEVLG